MSADAAPELRHIVVAAGTPAEWAALEEQDWAAVLDDVGKVADQVGASWLVLRPAGGEPCADARRRERSVGGCLVSAEPEPDGRARLAAVIEGIRRAGGALTQAAVDAAINAPAGSDPDLVVVLGPSHRLPASLVWELAYSELVFIDIPWLELSGAHLEDAIGAYAGRHRRFGGVD